MNSGFFSAVAFTLRNMTRVDVSPQVHERAISAKDFRLNYITLYDKRNTLHFADEAHEFHLLILNLRH